MLHHSSAVKYLECSLRNGYGLRHFYNFLNVPFLKMKRTALLKQVTQCEQDLEMAEKECEMILEQVRNRQQGA